MAHQQPLERFGSTSDVTRHQASANRKQAGDRLYVANICRLGANLLADGAVNLGGAICAVNNTLAFGHWRTARDANAKGMLRMKGDRAVDCKVHSVTPFSRIFHEKNKDVAI